MNSDSEFPQEKPIAPSTEREPDKQATQSQPDVPIAAGVPSQPPPKPHYEITCKTEKTSWDKFKDGAEIIGICLLAIYTWYSIKMYCANRDAANAAKSAAETAASQLELAERPWVDASIAIDGPFSFDMSGDSVAGARIPLKIVLRNTGHSPAVSVAISPRLTLAKGDDIFDRRDEACKFAKDTTKNGHWGITLFPNANPFEKRIIAGGGNYVEKGKVWPPSSGFEMLPPSIIVCVAYRPTFSKTSVYRTAYIFDLLRLDSTNTPIYFQTGENVDQRHLLLKGHEMDAISAD
jgi:hypothetical protein